MADAPHAGLMETMFRLQQSLAKAAESRHWHWLMFGQDVRTGRRFEYYSPGPVVSLGLPWLSKECSLRWLGLRFFFWPAGIPSRRRISIVSSRLKQRLDQESWWFDLLRTTVLRMDPANDVLCIAAGSAAERFVSRSAELFGRSALDFQVDATEKAISPEGVCEWLSNVAMAWTQSAGSSEQHAQADFLAEPQPLESYAPGVLWRVCVSPPMTWPTTTDSDLADPANGKLTVDLPISNQPIADRILFAAGERLQVLRARRSGAIQSLLTYHVHDPERQTSLVMLAANEAGETQASDLEQFPCVIPWLVRPLPESTGTDDSHRSDATSDFPGHQVSTFPDAISSSTPLSRPEDWLLHWTRPAVGPWPDQETREFEDELILGCRSSDRSALATLLRIVNEKRLWASSEAIRGGFPVVSFTEVALREFRGRRTYRRHRRRYDFEPWGIAIRRDSLQQVGAQRVIYGDEETWLTMPDDQRPYFQNINAGDGWTREELEWRVADHVTLDLFPATAVAVFVDTANARQIVMMQTDWPVFVVP